MSKLLIDDSPLQVLPKLATRVGLNEAIFLQQLHFLTKDKRVGPDGHQWLRKTYPQWGKDTFPFWSVSTIERAAKAVAKLGLVIIEQRDKSNRNRDNFYAIDREFFAKWEQSGDGLDTAKLTVSEAVNLADSEPAKMTDSYKDQILIQDQETDHTPRGKPRRGGSDPVSDVRREMISTLESYVGPLPKLGNQTKALNWLFENGYERDECKRCLEWLLSQKWRTTAITWVTVRDQIGNWVRLGSPNKELPKPASNNGNSGGQYHGGVKVGDIVSPDDGSGRYTVMGDDGTPTKRWSTPEAFAEDMGYPIEEVRKGRDEAHGS